MDAVDQLPRPTQQTKSIRRDVNTWRYRLNACDENFPHQLNKVERTHLNEPIAQMRKKHFWLIATVAILAAIAIQAYICAKGFYAISGDESGHTLDAWRWSREKSLHPAVWLPFYTTVVGITLDLFPNLFRTPRIISFLFGLGTLAVIGWLTHALFGRREITSLSLILGAFLPERVVLSVVPLTEIMFMFVIATASALLAVSIRTKSNRTLIWCAIAVALACTIRYEGWVFATSFVLLILYQNDWKSVPLVARMRKLPIAIVVGFPTMWMLMNFFQGPSPFQFLLSPIANYTRLYGTSLPGLLEHCTGTQFFLQNILSWNILGILGLIVVYTRDDHLRKWLFFPAGAFVLMTALSLGGKMLPNHNFWRIAAVWSSLLIPFTAFWIVEQQKLLLIGKRMRRLVSGVITLLVLLNFCRQIEARTLYADFGFAEREAGEFISQQTLLRSESIIIESTTWQYLHILVASQRPELFIGNSGNDPARPMPPIIDIEDTRCIPGLVTKGIHYLVFKNTLMKKYLDDRKELIHTKDFGEWAVYAVKE